MRVVIIDDEPQLRNTNKTLLQNNFPEMEVVGEAGTVKDSIELIKSTNPDLVLLDVELEDGNCFQVLQACKPYSFKPIFITAHNDFAIKAIKFSAIDYILKPVNEFEFCNAVSEAIRHFELQQTILQNKHFEENYRTKGSFKHLVLKTTESMYVVDIKDILYCRSDNSYTTFFLENGQEIIVSKSIKEYTSLLSEYRFIRPHQSFLVNIAAISKIDKRDSGFIILKNKKEIPISSRRKQAVFSELEKL